MNGIHDDDLSGVPEECECDCMCEEGLPFTIATLTLLLGTFLAAVITGCWGALHG